MLFRSNSVQGPNHIGIAAERLEKILHNLERRGNERGGSRSGGFNRNRNRSGGGGYRGNNDRNGGSGGSGERGGNDRGERSRSFSGNRSSKPKY